MLCLRPSLSLLLGSTLVLAACDDDESEGGESETETDASTSTTSAESSTTTTTTTSTSSTSGTSTSTTTDGSTGGDTDGLYDLLGSISNDAMVSGQWVLSVDGTFVNDGSLATAADVQFNAEGLADGSSYTIAIESSPVDQCTGENLEGTVSGADVTGITITCMADTTVRYNISGTLAGATSADGFVRLVDTNGDDLDYTSSSAGATVYSFNGVPENSQYELVFSNENFNCTGNASASGTLTMNVDDAVLTCTAQ